MIGRVTSTGLQTGGAHSPPRRGMSEPPAPAPIDWEEERLAPRSIAAGDPTGWF
jgi:hypothetical protein